MKSPSSSVSLLGQCARRAARWAVTVTLCAWGAAAATPGESELPFRVVERFENFGVHEGMPSKKIHSVLKASDGKLYVGTWNGLLVREGDQWHRYGVEDGLSHKMVLCLVEHPRTGDIWCGTMRGLNRLSGGLITSYTQTSSGLPNNVVYGIDIVDDVLWSATAAGTGALDLKTKEWKIYDHNNSAMHEPWCYTVKGAKDRIFIGVWGGGILEHDPKTGSFKEYRDPDRDFHYTLVPDAGPVNDITSWLAYEQGILWQTTYFGVSRYDGRGWRNWVQDKSPLVSNFAVFVWAHNKTAWIGTDKGISVTDGNYWVNYLVDDKEGGSIEIHRPGQPVEKRTTATALPNGFVLGIYVDDDEAWFATEKGLSRGLFAPQAKTTHVAGAR